MTTEFGTPLYDASLYTSDSEAVAGFLDWFLETRSVNYDRVIEEINEYFLTHRRPYWMTDNLLRAELPAALKNAKFQDERAELAISAVDDI